MSFSLAAARTLLSLSESEIRQRLGPDAYEDPESEYEGLEDVLELRNEAVFPGSIYLRDGAVELIYAPRAALEGVAKEELEAELTGEPERLRSRAGKKANLLVRADQGVAYSADRDRVHFVEVFPPCTLEDYRERIYIDPGAFIR